MSEKESAKAPKELDAIADLVLAYKAKPKSILGKKRKKKAKNLEREMGGESRQNPILNSNSKRSDN